MKTSLLTLISTRTFLRQVSLLVWLTVMHCSIVNATDKTVTVVPCINISADKAANSGTASFTLLNEIVIKEQKADNFEITGKHSRSCIITAPQGWIFNAGKGSVSFRLNKDIRQANLSVQQTTIQIDLIVSGTSALDYIRITGIQVQALDGTDIDTESQLFRSATNPGTAKMSNIICATQPNGVGGTSFYTISQSAGVAAKLVFTSKPSMAVAGTQFEEQPSVMTTDQFGNFTREGLPSELRVQIKLSSGEGTLSGNTEMNIGTSGGNGTITFAGLSISEKGKKKLMVIAAPLSFAVTNHFDVESGLSVSYDSDNMCVAWPLSNLFINKLI
jgi:hypothetical protein